MVGEGGHLQCQELTNNYRIQNWIQRYVFKAFYNLNYRFTASQDRSQSSLQTRSSKIADDLQKVG